MRVGVPLPLPFVSVWGEHCRPPAPGSGGIAAASAGAAAFALARRKEKRRLDQDLERLLDQGSTHNERSASINSQCVE